LFAAITRLLWWALRLYTVGIVSGFFTGHPLLRVQVMAAIALWLLYAAILQARHLKWLAPKRGPRYALLLQRCSGASMGNHIHRGAHHLP